MELIDIAHLIAYIIIYSFLGWILETIYKSIYNKKFVNSGFLMGPLCPIYGFGGAIMYLFLDSFKDNIFLLFAVAVVILTIWEYLVGVLLEKLFKTKYWDYSECFMNFQGRICLRAAITWGILGVVFTLIIHPVFINVVTAIPVKNLIYIEAFLVILIFVDIFISVLKVTKINIGIEKLIDIIDMMKTKMDELKELTGKANEKSVESLKSLIKELKEKEASLKQFVSTKTERLRLAFPSMKLEKVSKILNKKIDILELLKNDKK